MKIWSLLIILLSLSIHAETYYPSNILQMDKKFAHHVIVVEKSTHTLFLYENNKGTPKLVEKYKIATGKKAGNKKFRGDHKTPEGVYQLNTFHSAQDLSTKYGESAEIYGAGAFTLNYPNLIDARKGKTGGGIWLHSTDDNSRISKGLDSRGCVVVVDKDLKDISKYIDLNNTSMIITEDLTFNNKKSWETNKNSIYSTVLAWAKSWKAKEFDNYINSYSKTEFKHRKGGFNSYKRYKRRIFNRIETPKILFSNISILRNEEYVVVTLEQNYSSSLVSDIGKKTLYLKKDKNYQWKIVGENWSSMRDKSQNIAFVPSMRFFNNEESDSKKTN